MDFKHLDEYLKSITSKTPYDGALVDKDAAYVQKATTKLPFCGAIVSVGDKTVYSNFFGSKNDKGEPFDEHTPLFIYSMTKTFTTLCGLLLLERGLINLHDELSFYMPEFKEMQLYGGAIAQKPLLVDHLFRMETGFDYELNAPEICAIKADHEFRTQDIVTALSRRPLLFEPGTAWRYSLSHDVLGALIERVSGMTLSEFMTENIFKPLGMTETTFHPTAETLEKMGDQYDYVGNGKLKKIEKKCAYRLDSSLYESGGAGLVSTAHDLAIYARAVTGGKLLSKYATDVWRAPVCPPDAPGAWYKPGYGYARGVRVMTHPELAGCLGSKGEFGWDGAAGSWIMFDPENNLSAVFTQHVLSIGAFTFDMPVRNMIYSAFGRK